MNTLGLRAPGTGGGDTVIVTCDYSASIIDDILSADCMDMLSANINNDMLTAEIADQLTASINITANEATICPAH